MIVLHIKKHCSFWTTKLLFQACWDVYSMKVVACIASYKNREQFHGFIPEERVIKTLATQR